MNNFLSQKILLVHNTAFYEKKFLIILCLISALHVLIVLWIVYSFNKITPSLNHSSTLGGAAIQVRFLSTPIQVSATAIEISFKTPNPTSQPSPRLITSITGGDEVVSQKKAPQQSREKNETSSKENQSTRNQVRESNQHSNLTTPSQENLKINDVQEKAPIASTSASTHKQPTSYSSPQTNITSKESVEKTKTQTAEFKALNRRLNYPTRARSLGVEGRIRVQFDITSNGTISNIQVLSETPAGVFTDSVLKDMARWRYQTTGEVKNQIVSIVFKLDGRVVLDN